MFLVFGHIITCEPGLEVPSYGGYVR